MDAKPSLSRREFLKILPTGLFSVLIPPSLTFSETRGYGRILRLTHSSESDPPPRAERLDWPALTRAQLPPRIKAIMNCMPACSIDAAGNLVTGLPGDQSFGKVQASPTLWNKEHSHPWNRLDPRYPWGIVLHWYGDQENFTRTIPGYLWGFDGLRLVGSNMIRTSAHFLVGDDVPHGGPADPKALIGILQTQIADADGIPFLASHLRPLNIQEHKEKKQYFVRALYQLATEEGSIHSLLQDFFDGPGVDPNMRTIAIEITGCKFDSLAGMPSDQKVANVVSVVWALMKRYGIPASHLLGHHEISLAKPDPGKKFIALVRHLLGVKALLEDDPAMRMLVFGQFLNPDTNAQEATRKYFKFTRDYIVLTSIPRQVYEWESQSNYWLLTPGLHYGNGPAAHEPYFDLPTSGRVNVGRSFLLPANHEGVDFHCSQSSRKKPIEVHLASGGECIFTGQSKGKCPGQVAMFRHCQSDGAQVITVYDHLNEVQDLHPGRWYPGGMPLAMIEHRDNDQFLHFAVAYGSTWETDLRANPDIPGNAGPTWIRQRYLPPVEYLLKRGEQKNEFLASKYRSE